MSGDDKVEMMLSHDEEERTGIWGLASCTSSSQYHYEDEEKIMTEHYAATFLLAYKTSSEDVELKCLGGSDSVAEVANMVDKMVRFLLHVLFID